MSGSCNTGEGYSEILFLRVPTYMQQYEALTPSGFDCPWDRLRRDLGFVASMSVIVNRNIAANVIQVFLGEFEVRFGFGPEDF